MIIGVTKEIKADEYRVGITPAGVKALTDHGHKVLVESGAGLGSRIGDDEFAKAGASMLPVADVWAKAEMIMKVKEPLPSEYKYFRPGLLLFTYLHLAADKELTDALLKSGVVGLAYETVQPQDRSLPLLAPMSEVAGRMAVQMGSYILTKQAGGAGMLLGGVAGVQRARVAIVGGGTVGTEAAKMAMGLGAEVTILDNNLNRLRYLGDIFSSRVQTLASNEYNIAGAVKDSDLVIGSVLIPGAMAPKLVTEAMIKTMRPGSVVVDVAIDQGGSFETTAGKPTTHHEPTFEKHGVIHYAVANIPGAVPVTSTYALTNATLPFAVELADKGWKNACRDNIALERGLNTVNGQCTFAGVAEAFGLPCVSTAQILR